MGKNNCGKFLYLGISLYFCTKKTNIMIVVFEDTDLNSRVERVLFREEDNKLTLTLIELNDDHYGNK